ncbi:xanthine dehydrogenase D subunit [Paenibacillus sp. DS2015]|uniref:xanthine dehydrogenase subunit D n=1 Tax=Paenibacillus sp. DS2015 TaxID=3373917 RepID=UPI003D22EFB0
MLLTKESSGKRWHLRPDGKDKVTGHLQYLTDLTAPGMLYGKVLRSEHPHAIIISLDTRHAERVKGVRAVITHKDVPGLNRFGIDTPDQPVMCEDRVRYLGDAIAAVAADTPEIARYAITQIRVNYRILDPIDSTDAALAADAEKLHPEGNVLHRTANKWGDIDEALERSAYIVKEVYTTPRQMHGYMETEGGIFIPEEDGRLTVYAATQHGYMDRMQLSRILAIAEEKIRVISSPIGGSFGGKDELNVQPYGSLLALKTGCPVKMHNSRVESVVAGLKRHPMTIVMETGMDEGGLIQAHRVQITADTGAYTTLGRAVLNFATEHALGPYHIPHVDVEGVCVFTNNGLSGEFRGFGGNQVIFAMEGQMDRLAEKLGVDPWEFRQRNMRSSTDLGPLGQRMLRTDGLQQVSEALEQSSLWRERGNADSLTTTASPPWIKRGMGAAVAMHGAGLGYGIPDPAGGRLSINRDGKIEVAFSFEEFGQGLIASLEIMLCTIFGCVPSDLSIVIGDTDRVPSGGSSTASRSTTMAWMALQKLKEPFIEKVLTVAAEMTGIPAKELTTGAMGIRPVDESLEAEVLVTYKQIVDYTQEDLIFDTEFHYPTTPDEIVGGHFLYTYASVVAEVEVNTLTGQVKLLRNYHVIAAGPVINPMGYIGQIEGGSVMALGFTLTEDILMSESQYLTRNFDTYMMPTIRDIHTSLEVEAIEELPEGDPFGPRGIGEIGSVALAPAIVSAIHHATGVWVNRLPVSCEMLIQKLALPTQEEVSLR